MSDLYDPDWLAEQIAKAKEVDAYNARMRGETDQPPPKPLPAIPHHAFRPIEFDLTNSSQTCNPLCEPARNFTKWFLNHYPDILTTTSYQYTFEAFIAMEEEFYRLFLPNPLPPELHEHGDCIAAIHHFWSMKLFAKQQRISLDYYGVPGTADIALKLPEVLADIPAATSVDSATHRNAVSEQHPAQPDQPPGPVPKPEKSVAEFLADLDDAE